MPRSPLLAVLVLASGCAMLFPAPAKMESALDLRPGPEPAKCLIVLLPGIADTAEVFRQQGFVEAIRNSGVSADVVAANATPGYYFEGSLSERIEVDVIAPLRTRQYQQIWLVGVSIGGLGSLQYTQAFPQHVDGILALAPYVGSLALGEEIRRAGGLEKWTPDPPAPITASNAERQLWSWLHNVVTGKQPGPAIYVGFGDHDGLVGQDSLLSDALPPAHVLHAPGVHDWPTWRAVLEQFLRTRDFQLRCGAESLPIQPVSFRR